MPDACARDFLAQFDRNRYPAAFQARYEAMECLSHNDFGETLLVRERASGDLFVAKCRLRDQKPAHAPDFSVLKALDHPGLPRFIDEFENEMMDVAVRAYVEGRPLFDLETPLPLARVLDAGVQLCDVLIYLHGRTPPLLHRDIKPQNVILGEDGRVTLIDFGIARVLDGQSLETSTFYGTTAFAPPEQYGFSQTDCRSDIFSLGVLLMWLATGETNASVALDKIENRNLRRVIGRCTSFAPKDRYADVGAVKRALAALRPGARTKRFALCACVFVLTTVLAIFAVSALGNKAQSTLQDVPARLADEAPVSQSVEYLAARFDTRLFDDTRETLTCRRVREWLIALYGLDAGYVYAAPPETPAYPHECADNFFPWKLPDSETIPLDVMTYIAVKLYFPDVVTDYSRLQGDTGVYPGVRAALLFAEDSRLLEGVNRPDPLTIGDAAVLLARADRLAEGYASPTPAPTPTPKPVSTPSPLGFTQPLLEKAARASLGLSQDATMTRSDLSRVTALYVLENEVYPSSESFYAAIEDWYQTTDRKGRGPVDSLADLALMPNLRILGLVAQRFTDLAPLAGLSSLEKIEFKHGAVRDLSALAGLENLAAVGLNDNPVSDLSALSGLTKLRFLDLCDADGYDAAFLDSLTDFDFLDISNRTDSYKHLSGKRVGVLKLGYSGVDSLDWLRGVTGLRELELQGAKVTDLTPLLSFPDLITVTLSESMRPLADQLSNPSFTVLYR